MADEDEEESQLGPSKAKQRVTAKGSNVPEAAESFHELRDRYAVPSQIMANLSQSGFSQPTGIQSHGIPIILEVR